MSIPSIGGSGDDLTFWETYSTIDAASHDTEIPWPRETETLSELSSHVQLQLQHDIYFRQGSHKSCSSAVDALADVLVGSLETVTHLCDLKGLFLQLTLLLMTLKCTYLDVATRWGDLSRLWEWGFQKVSPSEVKCETNRTSPSVPQVSRSIYNSHTITETSLRTNITSSRLSCYVPEQFLSE